MRIYSGIAGSARRLTRGALAIGNFDGVHLGHRGLFDAAKASARKLGGPSSVLTFEPHPARLLAPEYAPPLISSPARKLDLLAATGAYEVVVGHDFTYGRERGGTVDTLGASLTRRGLRLHVVAPITVHGLVVSSTKIREFTLEGRVEAAAQLLGRPFDLEGDVVRGAGRGRKLGWPTANIRTDAELLPAVGVYAVRARLIETPTTNEGGSARGATTYSAAPAPAPGQQDSGSTYVPPTLGPPMPGAANLGLNPTFRDAAHAGSRREPLMLEVHLLDVDQDLYGRALRVEFVHRLRDERRFPNVEALKEQIARDVAAARGLLHG